MVGGSKGGRYAPAWYVYAAAQVLKQAHPFDSTEGPLKQQMYTLVVAAFADHLEFNGRPLDITRYSGFSSADEVYKNAGLCYR